MSAPIDPKSELHLTEEEYSLIDKLKNLYKKLFQLSIAEKAFKENLYDKRIDVEQKPSVKDGL